MLLRHINTKSGQFIVLGTISHAANTCIFGTTINIDHWR